MREAMTQRQLKTIAKAAMDEARNMAQREAARIVTDALKDTTRSLESIFDEHFECETSEQRDFVMSELRKGREEYLKTGIITIK